MNRVSSRLFTIDGDTVEIKSVYDAEIGQYIYDYPDFNENPRITPDGRRWVNVTNDNCPYADEEYGDCGSCRFFRSENEGDLIGVCDNSELIVLKGSDTK